MRYFCLILSMSLPVLSWAQQSYFNPQNKADGLEYYKDLIYRGCSDLKEKQDPVTPKELNSLTSFSKNLVNESFGQAFAENPKVKAAFEKDLDLLAKDTTCQREGNDCRVRLMGLSLYYFQTFRPDLLECKTQSKDKELCDSEKRLRTATLQGVHASSYSPSVAAKYKKQLITSKNALTSELFTLIMNKDKTNLHICNNVQSGLVHQYALEMTEPGEYYAGLDPDYDPKKNQVKECIDEKISLHQEFILSNFDEGRNSVGIDHLEPLKQKILQFVKAHPEFDVTDVSVTTSSSKTPLYATIAGKKVLDPQSNDKNMAMATERASFVTKMMNDIKTYGSQFQKINFESRAELAGPEFEPMDLNNRFITKMTPGYMEKVDLLYKKFEKDYQGKALLETSAPLMNETQFVNLYQAKFKPFHGFLISIKGHKKDEMKCLEFSNDGKRNIRQGSKQ